MPVSFRSGQAKGGTVKRKKRTYFFKCDHTADHYVLGRYGAECPECKAKMTGMVSTCIDCGVEIHMTPRQGNRVRCVLCASIHKAEYNRNANKKKKPKRGGNVALLVTEVQTFNIFTQPAELFRAMLSNDPAVVDDRKFKRINDTESMDQQLM